jgi:uncharacterized protein (TIGR02001 family)
VLHGLLLPVQSAHSDDRWSGSIGASTDYIYRGVTQTGGKSAVQASVDIRSVGGWSAGLWSSTVDLNRDGSTGYEIDLHASRSWYWGEGWSAAVGVTHREYLSDQSALDYDYDELNAALSYQQRVTASVAWSPNTSMYWRGPVRGHAAAYELTFQQPVGLHWSVFAGAGRYDLQDLAGEAYNYWSAGVTFTWAALQFDAAHIGADDAAEHLFGYDDTRSRWTGAFTVRF